MAIDISPASSGFSSSSRASAWSICVCRFENRSHSSSGTPSIWKSSARAVANAVAELRQFARQFVVIGVLDEFPGTQKFVVLERFPALLGWVERRVEDDAMGVQMRVERARGIMGEQCRREIFGQSIALRVLRSDTRVAANASNSCKAERTALA